MKEKDFSKTTKVIIIICIIIFTVALACREYQIRGGSYGRMGKDYIIHENR